MKAILAALAFLALLLAPARAQTILFQDNFEGGLGNWTATGLWHVQTETNSCGATFAPFPSGDRGVYYGLDGPCNYDTGTANLGDLILAAPVFIPANSPRAVIRFWSHRCAEDCSSGFDATLVQVSPNGGAIWTTVNSACPHPKVGCDTIWREWEADISPFIGSAVLVRFLFYATDEFYNDFGGWMIDDVSIRIQPGRPFGGANCPCGNPPPGTNAVSCSCLTGCKNSSGRWSELGGTGYPRVSQDNVQLVARELAVGASATFLQGSTAPFTPLGDGVFGLANPTFRLGTKASVGGVARYPENQDPQISVQGQIPIGGALRIYQVLYRDTDNFCTSSQINLTNAYAITWVP